MGRGLTGDIAGRLLGAALAASVAAGLAGCGGGGSMLSSVKNPFSKEEEKLPGERISVITESNTAGIDGGAMRPVSVPPPRVNASWSQPGGSPSNNLGHLALSESVNKVWSADAGTGSSSRGRLSAVPLVADGKIYTLDAGGTVAAFSASSGGAVWSANVTPKSEKKAEGFGGGLALDGGRLYATTGYGTVVALDPGNGAVVWTKSVGKPVRSSPTASGGKVYFVSTDNVLHALSGSSGEELWKARGLPQTATLLSNVSPAVSSGIVVAPFPAGDITAFATGSGQSTWTESLTRSSDSTEASGILGDPARPVIDRGVVFAVSHGGKMIASSESTGERLWTRNIASTQMPWVAGDTVYVVDTSGKMLALSRADGSVRWTAELPQNGRWSGPVLAGNRAWAISADGLLIGVDARGGHLVTNVNLDTEVFVSPVVAGGRMYILADNAQLIALN